MNSKLITGGAFLLLTGCATVNMQGASNPTFDSLALVYLSQQGLDDKNVVHYINSYDRSYREYHARVESGAGVQEMIAQTRGTLSEKIGKGPQSFRTELTNMRALQYSKEEQGFPIAVLGSFNRATELELSYGNRNITSTIGGQAIGGVEWVTKNTRWDMGYSGVAVKLDARGWILPADEADAVKMIRHFADPEAPGKNARKIHVKIVYSVGNCLPPKGAGVSSDIDEHVIVCKGLIERMSAYTTRGGLIAEMRNTLNPPRQ